MNPTAWTVERTASRGHRPPKRSCPPETENFPNLLELVFCDEVARLRRVSLTFAALWDTKDATPFVTTQRVFDHPIAGRLELDHHRLAVLDQPGTQLVVYTSAPATTATRRLLGEG